jgi:hypothetical protein
LSVLQQLPLLLPSFILLLVFFISVLKGFHVLEVVLCRFSPYIDELEKFPDRSRLPFYTGYIVFMLLFS